MNRFLRWITAVTACVFLLTVAALHASDTIKLTNKKSYTGYFTGYQKSRILFRTTEGKKLRESSRTVKDLILNPPTKVTVNSRRSRSKAKDVILVSFSNAVFHFKEFDTIISDEK